MSLDDLRTSIQASGRITRSDIQAVLDHYNDPANATSNLQLFLEEFNFLDDDEKQMMLDDILSYERSHV